MVSSLPAVITAQQGLNAVMEVFIVSFVTSTITGLTVLLTGAWRSGQTSTAAVASAFDAANGLMRRA